MMRRWLLRKAIRTQANNLVNVLAGLPLTTPSLGSMTLDRDDVRLARHWLRSRREWTDTGVVAEYENEFAKWNGSKYAVALLGGRVALSACIYALDMRAGDEVILPGYTCVVVPNAFHYAGITTVFSDIELDTYGLDATCIEEKITNKTRAILIQHLYGLVCRDYERILDIAKRRNLKVIEDCAHSTGAELENRKVGNRGDVAIYSSEQSKVFNTIQGGLAVTNDDGLAATMREYSDRAPHPTEDLIERQLYRVILNYYQQKHPQRWWCGDLAELFIGDKTLITTTPEEQRGIRPSTYGCRMPAPIAALGRNQLKKVDQYNVKRRTGAERWHSWCDKNGYKKPLVVSRSLPVYLRYPVLVEPEKKRNPLWAVKELGVEPGVWFLTNIHPVKWEVHGCPNADLAVERCINFPCLN